MLRLTLLSIVVTMASLTLAPSPGLAYCYQQRFTQKAQVGTQRRHHQQKRQKPNCRLRYGRPTAPIGLVLGVAW